MTGRLIKGEPVRDVWMGMGVGEHSRSPEEEHDTRSPLPVRRHLQPADIEEGQT